MITRPITRHCALLALAGALLAADTNVTAQTVTQPALKAAFLYNFAKFAEWPDDQGAAGPITLCVVEDAAVDDALEQLVRGGPINGRAVTVLRGNRERLRQCHLLYMTGDPSRALGILEDLKGAPVLTVSDGEQFTHLGGIIGLFLEDGKMRFAVNADAAQRCGIRLSSRLLSLAKLVKEPRHAQP